MQVYTSVSMNYVPKARVLAHSLKRFHPEAKFHLILSDGLPEDLAQSPAPFDRILQVESLPVENVRTWIFEHNLVELCTAVKGVAARRIMEENPGEPTFYIDPDIVVLAPLDRLIEELGRHDVLLTPHQLDPEEDREAVMDNEISSLRHGVYNLGFLGIAPTDEGRRFVNWWAERLRWFCRAEIDQGLFTDQRWADLAPAFFPTLGILRDPGCNVATWNLTQRTVGGSFAEGFTVNGQPLLFYHFSGFDSGQQKRMLDKFGRNNAALYELRRWYIEECRRMGQDQLGHSVWSYGRFPDGRPITDHHRRLYRSRMDIQQAFPEPWSMAGPGKSYCEWYDAEVGEPLPENRADLEQELLRWRREVEAVNQSNTIVTADNQRLVTYSEALARTNEHMVETNKTLNAQIHTLTQAGNAASHTNAALNAANEALIHANISHVQTNAALNGANRRMQDDLAAARHEIDEARKLLDSARYQLDLTRDQLEIARNELSHVYRSKGYRAVRTVSHLIRGHWLRSA